MKLIALLIGLIVERLATQLFHLREFRWLDRLIDAGFGLVTRFANWPALIPVVLLAALLVLPVFGIIFGLGDALFGYPYMILAIIVLFFSLGPKDIGEDIDEYCEALKADDAEHIDRSVKALIEKDAPPGTAERMARVEEAVCVQANNRLFAVIFWFVLLGPFGAWLYRVTDLIRRRAVFKASRAETDESAPRVLEAASALHGALAWIPAHLTAIGYAMAGSFDGAISAWRSHPEEAPARHAGESSEQLLARVGVGALALHDIDGESDTERAIRGATAAKGMVYRLFFIWAAVIAIMTLYGWSV